MYIIAYPIRHILSTALAVLVAMLFSRYVLNTNAMWMVLTTFFTVSITQGAPLRQSMLLMATMIVVLVASFFLMGSIGMFAATIVAVIGFASCACVILINPFITFSIMLRVMLFPMALLIVLLLTRPVLPLGDQLIQIVIGVVIGLICHHLFPIRLEQDFRRGLVPVLQASHSYIQAITDYFLQWDKEDVRLSEKKEVLRKSLQYQYSLYPEWAYEVGFNPGLRAGFRFYLVNIERMTEIFFSMEYFAMCGVAPDILQLVSDAIFSTMQNNAALLELMLNYAKHRRVNPLTQDFTSDVARLEEIVTRIVPDQLELLDISQDYVTLVAFVRDVKDLRRLLLQLVMGVKS